MESTGLQLWGCFSSFWIGGPDTWFRRGIQTLVKRSSFLSPACAASAVRLKPFAGVPFLCLQQQPAALQAAVDTPKQQQEGAAEAAAEAAAAEAAPQQEKRTPGAAEGGGGAATAAANAAADAEADAATDGAADAAAKNNNYRLHFCDETNEPEDVCNAQWLVLWSYAAYAPERPSDEEQQLLKNFFEFFPDQCTEGPAANCYTEAVKKNPPRVSSRRDLLLWLCLVENQCRQKIGAPLKPCRYRELMRRWRYTDGYV